MSSSCSSSSSSLGRWHDSLTGYTGYGLLNRIESLLYEHKVGEDRALLLGVLKSVMREQHATAYCEKLLSVCAGDMSDQLEWLDQAKEARQQYYMQLDQELAKARSTKGSQQLQFELRNRQGAFFLDQGNFDMALTVFTKNLESFGDAHQQVLIVRQLVRRHMAAAAYDQAEEIAAAGLRAVHSLPDPHSHQSDADAFHASIALAAMHKCMWRQAADHFLLVSSSVAASFSDVVLDRDLAAYALAAVMAGYHHSEIKPLVLQCQSFSPFFALDSLAYRTLLDYHGGRYTDALANFDRLLDARRHDYYLAHLCHRLRAAFYRRVLVRYFQPYAVVDLRKAAAVLRTDVDQLQQDLADLIFSPDAPVKGLIDSHNRIFYASESNQRAEMYRAGLDATQSFLSGMQTPIFRFSAYQKLVSQ